MDTFYIYQLEGLVKAELASCSLVAQHGLTSCTRQQDTQWIRAKQHLAPAAEDITAPMSEMPMRGDRATKQKVAEPKQRDTEE